jgi:hypothetical protein
MYVECSCSHESHPCNYRRRNAYEDCLHLRIIKHMPQLTRVFCHNEPKFFRTGMLENKRTKGVIAGDLVFFSIRSCTCSRLPKNAKNPAGTDVIYVLFALIQKLWVLITSLMGLQRILLESNINLGTYVNINWIFINMSGVFKLT